MVPREPRLVGAAARRPRRKHTARPLQKGRLTPMRLLLLGGTGQVGEEIRSLPLPNDVELVAPNRGAVDLEDPRAIAAVVAEEQWSAVINAAAYTDVDRAEAEEPLAFALNANAASVLAKETGRRGIPVLQLSTDYVFDGHKG